MEFVDDRALMGVLQSGVENRVVVCAILHCPLYHVLQRIT